MPQLRSKHSNRSANKPFVAPKIVKKKRKYVPKKVDIVCPVCGKGVRMRKDGTPYKHKVGYHKLDCLGG